MWINNELFKLKDSDIPKVPIEFSTEALEFWKLQKKYCIEGITIGGKYMPGNLYFYINFGTIRLNKDANSKTKVLARPLLRDIEWEVFTAWAVARGLNGFSKTGILSEKHEDVLYMLRNLNEDPGTPIYGNNAKNLMMMGVRGFGKSYISGVGIILHEWLFDGVKKYEIGYKDTTNIVIGAGDMKYPRETMTMAKISYDSLSKEGIMFGGRYYPHPLIKSFDGSFTNEITAKYKKKIGGQWLEQGSMSKINLVSYKDNPFAAQGKRCSVMVSEEIGMNKWLLLSHQATIENMIDDNKKFGSQLFVGCVCAGTKVYTNEGKLINIEELKYEDGILGYDSNGINSQTINILKPKEVKQCYKISLNDGSYIKCSDDHPLLMTKRHFYKYYDGKKIKRALYQEAKHIKINDQLLVPGKIDIFGSSRVDYARELGLMIGDGNCSENFTPSLSISENEIYNYIVSKYKVSISKEYLLPSNNYYRQVFIKDLIPYMEKHDLYGRVKLDKRLPNDIHTFNKQSVAELLAGYFDADGNIYYNKSKKIVRVVLTSIVEELLYEVKYQLLKFGIHCTIYKEKRNTEPSEEYKGQLPYICRLYITKQESINLFKDNIPMLVKAKTDNLKYIKKSKYKNFDVEFEINPLNNKEGYFSSNRIKDLTYVTVTNVEYIGEQHVYNLNCGPNHNYISNSLITRQTGGDMGGGTLDAYRMFYDPHTYDLLEYEDVWESKGKIGLFIAATKKSKEFKDENGNTIEEIATKHYIDEREKLRNSKNGTQALSAHIQYNPLVPSEVFLRSSGNIFPTTEIKEHLAELETNQLYRDAEMVCELIFNSEGKVEPRLDSQLEPIREFPMSGKSNQDTSGSIVIWHHPELDGNGEVPYGRYYLSLDPYRQEDAGRGASLGSIFVYDSIADALCAEYTGRPTTLDRFYERCRKLALYYNGQILYENEVTGTKQHFEHKNSLHLLMFQPEYIKDIIPGSKVERTYGIHMVDKLKDHGLLLLRDWLQDEYEPGKMNLRKIRSIPLLQELVLFDFDTNVDRISSMIVMMYAIKENHKQFVIENSTINKFKDPFFTRPLFSKR